MNVEHFSFVESAGHELSVYVVVVFLGASKKSDLYIPVYTCNKKKISCRPVL